MPSSLTLSPVQDCFDETARSRTLAEQFRSVRVQSLRLAVPLSAEDCALQSMPDASPSKWHLAHTSWFFDTFVLERALAGYTPFQPKFRMLFNSYYVAIGARHPRPERGLLSRPSLEEVIAYRRWVDERVARILEEGVVTADPDLARIVELGIHHEQQHQELMLTDLKHLLSRNPLQPAYIEAARPENSAAQVRGWLPVPGGLRCIGHDETAFCFDNETPRHRVYLDPYEIAVRPVTNREYAIFIEDGGYARPELWLAEGWDTCIAQGWDAPLYWFREGGRWRAFTLHGVQLLDPDAPVCHVSYYEADAYARWAGARLPSEAEWETLASRQPLEGHFLESRYHQPLPAPACGSGPAQLFGDVWEWTRSPYVPYPGYRPAPGAVGEYNGKFMVNQYVLRGGSCATPRSHIRPTYRNFFPAPARWQFSGIRLARDADA